MSSLDQIATQLTRLSAPLHSDLLPFQRLIPLHALRVALAWHQVVAAQGPAAVRANSGIRGLVGFLIQAFGGSTTSAVLMRTTPGFLASPLLLPFYAALYTLFSLARVPQVISALIPSFLLDIALASLDAVNRTLTVTSVLSLLASHPDPALHHNAYAACVLSAIAVSFGGILASALGVWEAEWRVQTPRILKPGVGILGTLDIWSGALVAAVYMVLVNWEGVRPYRASNLAVALRDAAGSLGGKTLGDGEGAAMTALHARTACTLLMGGLLVGRVLLLYGQAWWAVVRRAVPRDGTKKAKTAAAAGRADSVERAASATSDKSSVAHSTGVEPALGESPKKRKGAKGAVSKVRSG